MRIPVMAKCSRFIISAKHGWRTYKSKLIVKLVTCCRFETLLIEHMVLLCAQWEKRITLWNQTPSIPQNLPNSGFNVCNVYSILQSRGQVNSWRSTHAVRVRFIPVVAWVLCWWNEHTNYLKNCYVKRVNFEKYEPKSENSRIRLQRVEFGEFTTFTTALMDSITPPLPSSPIKALEPFIGTWKGEGLGFYPTIKVFKYGEEAVFSTWGKPVVGYT